MTSDAPGAASSFFELVGREQWQRLQDHFARVLGIGLRTISPDRTLLSNPSWPLGIDEDRLTSTLGLGGELGSLLPPQEPLPETAVTVTRPPFGLSFTAIPLRMPVRGIAGYWVLGPMMLGRREAPEAFRARLRDSGVDPEPAWAMVLTLKLYTFNHIRSVLDLLGEVSETLLELAYQSKTLQAIVPQVPRVDQAMADYYQQRLFQSLLDVATAATDAEGGSVMVYDRAREGFRIRAAEGLEDTVISGTCVRRGEGIAGLAACGKSILLLDQQLDDERFKPLMTRKDLVSSLVAPILRDHDDHSVGILNLRTTNAQRPFTREHVLLLSRLLSLAGVALESLRVACGAPRA